MSMNPVIISVGVRERYEPYVRRLRRTVAENWDGSTLFYVGEYPPGSPSHEDVNYAFKAYAIREAVRRGYTRYLYSDACVVARAPVAPLFEHLREVGVILIGDSHKVRDWTSDAVLDFAGLRREDIPPDRDSAAGGFVGIDLDHPLGREVHDRWLEAVDRNLTKVLWANGPVGNRASSCSHHTGEFISADPTVQGSMGDEAVLGALAWKLGIPVQPGRNPWCSQYWDGVFQSTGYDGGEHGRLGD